MKVRIIEKKFEATKAMKEKLEKKLSRFDKFFDGEADAIIVLKKVKDNEIAEVTMDFGETIFRAEERTGDMYASFDACIENLKKQIRKYKTKLDKRLKDKTTVPPVWDELEYSGEPEEEETFNIIRTKIVNVKPMFTEEAILQMNLLNHSFFAYKDANTGSVNIVYKRKNGDYGLIETK